MKLHFIWGACFLFCSALLSACGMFGAGSHVYCEPILLACPNDAIIEKLKLLKATGRYDDVRSFPDGVGQEANAPYSFYFYDRSHAFLVYLEVPLHAPKSTDLHLVAIKDFKVGNEWQDFNRDMSREKEKEVIAWFDETIRPALACAAHNSGPSSWAHQQPKFQ